MTILNPRDTYLAASVSTATPSQLLVMLYERLVLDVQRATDALRRGEPSQAHEPLLHAQEIVLELERQPRRGRRGTAPPAWPRSTTTCTTSW